MFGSGKRKTRPLYAEVTALWAEYDRDGSGLLDHEEIRELALNLPELSSEQVSHGLQLQSLWITPDAAVS